MATRLPGEAREPAGYEEVLRLGEVVGMLKKRFKIILGFFLVFLFGAVCFDYFSVPYYESAAIIRVSPPGRYTPALSDGRQSADTTRSLMSTYAELSRSRGVIQQVNDKLGSGQTFEEMSKKIAVKLLGDSELISLKVRDKSPGQATAILTALIDVLGERVNAGEPTARDSLQQRLREAQNERLKTEAAFQRYIGNNQEAPAGDLTYIRLAMEASMADAVLDRLMRQYEDFRLGEIVQAGAVKLIDPPSLPEKPLEPRWKYRRILFAGLLGLLSGAFLALYVECTRKSGGRNSV